MPTSSPASPGDTAIAHDDAQVRLIVLTGAGDKAFCAGADLQNTGGAFAQDFSRPNVDFADLLRLSQNATKPAIARVNGVCMAGGMGLLCMTDMAVASDHVIFGLPEVKVGVFPMQVLSLLQSIPRAGLSTNGRYPASRSMRKPRKPRGC